MIVEDNNQPMLSLGGASQSTIPNCDNLADIETEVETILTSGSVR